MTSDLKLDSRPLPVDGLMVDRCEEGVFLLHPDEPYWALTDETGVGFLKLANGAQSIKDMAEHVVAHFRGADETRVQNDLLIYFEQLRQAHLLKNYPGPIINKPVYDEPRRLTIYLTEECNLRCKHCFVVEGKMPQPKLDAEAVKSLIQSHTALYPGALVNFTGGEPFLRSDCLELAVFARTKTPQVSINSNGHLLTAEMAGLLAEHGIAIQISLDGPDPEMHDFIRGKGSFDKVQKAIRLLVDAGHNRLTRLSTTLTKCDVEDVRRLVQYARKMKIHEARFLILNRLKAAETNWDRICPDPEDLKNIYRYLLLEAAFESDSVTKIEGEFPGFVPHAVPGGDHWCPIGKTEIVDSAGGLYQCPGLLIPDYQVGNVSDPNASAVKVAGNRMRETMKRRRFVIPECLDCAWQNFCQGGCQAFTQLRTNSMYVNDEFCDFRRELYRKNAILSMDRVSGRSD